MGGGGGGEFAAQPGLQVNLQVSKRLSKLCFVQQVKAQSQHVHTHGPGGGGGGEWEWEWGSLIFHTYVGSSHFLGFKIFSFNIFFGFSKKLVFFGEQGFCGYFWGVITKLDYI